MMKKAFGLMMLALLLVLTIPAAAAQLDHITDDMGVLSDNEWSALERRGREIADQYGCGVYAVIVENYSVYGNSMEETCDYIYEAYELGLGADGDAVMLLLSMNDRDFWLESYGPAGDAVLTGSGRGRLESAMLDDFGQDDWYAGLREYLDESAAILGGGQDSGSSPVKAYGIALVVGLAVAFVTCNSFKAQMKTAVRATSAKEYVSPAGAEMRVRDDRYTHITRKERKIQRDSSGGSGASSGGGKF